MIVRKVIIFLLLKQSEGCMSKDRIQDKVDDDGLPDANGISEWDRVGK